MRCISPLLVRSNSRRDFVPCGKCFFCLESKRAEWSFRLAVELKTAESAHFLTITYDEVHVPNKFGLPTLAKEDLQKFVKRLRKMQPEKLRYYSVGEYGTRTERPHYHSIMFNMQPGTVGSLESVWKHGFVHVGAVTPASIHYVTKYVINRPGEYAGREPPFAMMSKRPGLGADYLRTHKEWHREAMRNYTQTNGIYGPLPRYFKEKMYNRYERDRLRAESVQLADDKFARDLDLLSRYSQDAFNYYYQRLGEKHEKVKNKVNQSSKF